jgi:hypothetical protein
VVVVVVVVAAALWWLVAVAAAQWWLVINCSGADGDVLPTEAWNRMLEASSASAIFGYATCQPCQLGLHLCNQCHAPSNGMGSMGCCNWTQTRVTHPATGSHKRPFRKRVEGLQDQCAARGRVHPCRHVHTLSDQLEPARVTAATCVGARLIVGGCGRVVRHSLTVAVAHGAR